MSDMTLKTQLAQAVADDSLVSVRLLLADRPYAADLANAPGPGFGLPPLARARSAAMGDLLIAHGASVEKLSEWWAPGFHTDKVDQEVAAYLVRRRGATVSVHAAAGLGLLTELRSLVKGDPALVHAKGGDGARPLHFARNVEVADALVEAGADVNARDDDHDSTPAQWLINRAPDVVRNLYIKHNAVPDTFVASALGDIDLVRALVEADPGCVAHRIGKPPFPAIGHEGKGGSILQWTLGFHRFAHQVAHERGHHDVFEYLYANSDDETKLLVNCVMARRDEALVIARENPSLVANLEEADKQLIAFYCWETNANIEAVRLMLDVGFPVFQTESNHAYSTIHNAAWGGYGDLVDLLIARGCPVNERDPGHGSTPLGFAIHCATVAKRHPAGEFGRVATSLLNAGCEVDFEKVYPTGHDGIDDAIEIRMKAEG